MWYDGFGGGKAIGELGFRIAANTIQKPVQLALSVVKPAGAGPAIRAAKNCRIAKIFAHAVEFFSHQRFGSFPTDLNVGVRAAQIAPGAGAALKPAFADHRSVYTGGSMLDVDDAGPDGRWVAVMFEPDKFLHAALTDLRVVGAPMGSSQR